MADDVPALAKIDHPAAGMGRPVPGARPGPGRRVGRERLLYDPHGLLHLLHAYEIPIHVVPRVPTGTSKGSRS